MSSSSKLKNTQKTELRRFSMGYIIWCTGISIALGCVAWLFIQHNADIEKRPLKGMKIVAISVITVLWAWLCYQRLVSTGVIGGSSTDVSLDFGWFDWRALLSIVIKTVAVVGIMLLIGRKAFEKRDWLNEDAASDGQSVSLERIHLPGLISWLGMTGCLLAIFLLPSIYIPFALLFMVVFWKIGGLYNPPVRTIWMVFISTTPVGGWDADSTSRLLGRAKKGWLENGCFHWTWLPSWLWFINITVFDSSDDVVEWKTDYLPTKAVKILAGLGDSEAPGTDGDSNEPVARGVDVEVKGIWTLKLVNPKQFMQLQDKDQANRDRFLGDIRKTFIARHLHTKTIVEVQNDDFMEGDSDVVKILQEQILAASGIKIFGWGIGDRNEDPEYKKEVTAYAKKKAELASAEMDAVIAEARSKAVEIEGKAEGKAVVAAINQIEDALKTGDKAEVLKAYTLLKAMEGDNKIIFPASFLDSFGSLLNKST